jgi:GT2 family glycosyltransferase
MTGLIRALQQSPRAGIAFGSVHAAEHDTRSSFIVNYEPRERRELRGRLGKLKDGGIGANMAIRTDAVRQVGWFDESLGPGAEFHACLDGDIAYRMLARGWSVVHVPESSVWHHGKRDLSSSGPAVRRTYQGIGACYFKYVRSGELAGVLLLGQQYLLVSRDVLRAAVSGRRPLGIGKLIGLTAGIWFSRRRAVDRSTLRYASE